MANKTARQNTLQPLGLNSDFLGEDRHELVAKLAYELWEKRGRPIGSPEIDWLAAEEAVSASLLTSGLIIESSNSSRDSTDKIYN
jgi:Protein of unknown function (DUF2934)